MSPTPVCIGHSQVKALARAAATASMPLDIVDLWTMSAFADDEPRRLRSSVRQRLDAALIVSLIGGNSHHRLGLVCHPVPYDFVLPDAPDLPICPAAQVVPYDGVRGAMLEALEPHLQLLTLVRRAAPGSCVHVEAPPVLADESTVERDVPWMFFGGRGRVSSRWLRLKLWRLHSALVREFCSGAAIGYLPLPPASQDADGFLRPEYYGDAMHVNERYGALVLEQIRTLR